MVYEFRCIHVASTVWIWLSSYFIHLLIVVCEILSAIHIALSNFCYFFPCPSPSLFYLCVVGYIMGLLALTVSGWSTLSCLIAVTSLALGVLGFPLLPIFSFLFSKNICCSFVFFWYYFYCSFPSLSHEMLGIMWSSVTESHLPL
jgi:hypothetical protein